MRIIRTNIGVIYSILLLCTLAIVSCKTTTVITGNLEYSDKSPTHRYIDLVGGIQVKAIDISSPDTLDRSSLDFNNFKRYAIRWQPSKEIYAKEAAKRYMKKMGFQVDQVTASDHMMVITIQQFGVKYKSQDIVLDISVYDPQKKLVYQTSVYQNVESYSTIMGNYKNGYIKALEQIDWDNIAALMRKPINQEQVQGTGNTILEHTIISWEVTSRPAGADLYWRIISSTPDVKNTNKNYKATTPYESTESFDIRGLTYQNSGDVQIELTCEKPGYLPQKKVFNVRMCLDQKSINAHFTLVKDE